MSVVSFLYEKHRDYKQRKLKLSAKNLLLVLFFKRLFVKCYPRFLIFIEGWKNVMGVFPRPTEILQTADWILEKSAEC